MFKQFSTLFLLLLLSPLHAFGSHFKKTITIVFENTNYDQAIAQPFLAQLAAKGALFSNFSAETHPSQPNYVALISGSSSGVFLDSPVTLSRNHIGDLLEAKGLRWKVYAEQYPGNCFLGASAGLYARKHIPFLSFANIQTNPARCANIVDSSALAADIQGGTLPEYSLYIPNLENDGHNTNAAYADRWLSTTFGPLLQDPKFTKDLLFVVTFDESELTGGNHIFTLMLGDGVAPGSVSREPYNHYNLLRTIEDEFGLGTLGQADATASAITGLWTGAITGALK